MHRDIRWLLISGEARHGILSRFLHGLFAILGAAFWSNIVQPVVVGVLLMIFHQVNHVMFEVVIAVVNMNNFIVFVVIYSRFSFSGRFCCRAVKFRSLAQNHLRPAQKEKKKKCIDTAWVHSYEVCCVDQRCLVSYYGWIPVQGSQVVKAPPDCIFISSSADRVQR